MDYIIWGYVLVPAGTGIIFAVARRSMARTQRLFSTTSHNFVRTEEVIPSRWCGVEVQFGVVGGLHLVSSHV